MANSIQKQVITNLSQLYAKAIFQPSGCIEWQGNKTRGGYGSIRNNGKNTATHRLACELVHGKPPTGALALHSCDNPPCINPDHLRWGSYTDNISDAIERKRWSAKQGIKNGRAKLTDEKVIQIRKLHSEGLNTIKLAEMFGVNNQMISRIVNRKAWIHVA